MTPIQINTVTGTTTPEELGRTLAHEHLLIGYPGWESDTLHPGKSLDEAFLICVDKIEEMKDAGFSSMIVTRMPQRPAVIAAAMPAGPAPTMTSSRRIMFAAPRTIFHSGLSPASPP